MIFSYGVLNYPINPEIIRNKLLLNKKYIFIFLIFELWTSKIFWFIGRSEGKLRDKHLAKKKRTLSFKCKSEERIKTSSWNDLLKDLFPLTNYTLSILKSSLILKVSLKWKPWPWRYHPHLKKFLTFQDREKISLKSITIFT